MGNQKQQLQDLYQYLLMKFQYLIQKYTNDSRQKIQNQPQLNPKFNNIQHIQHLTIFSLFIESSKINTKQIIESDHAFKYTYYQKLDFIQRLSCNFCSIIHLQQIKKQQKKIKLCENIIFDIVVKSSLKNIQNHLLQQEINNQQIPSQLNLQIKLLIMLCIVKCQKISSFGFSFQVQFFELINQKIRQIVQFYYNNKTIFDQNFSHLQIDQQKLQQDKLFSYLSSCLHSQNFYTLVNYLPFSIISSSSPTNFNNNQQYNHKKINEQLLIKYKQFQQLYPYQQNQQELIIYQNILQLHNIKQIIQNQQSFQKNQKIMLNARLNFLKIRESNLNLINLFNVTQESNQTLQLRFNSLLLKLFLKYPYKTSIFVLYQLIDNSNIKNINKFFQPLKHSQLIDPLTYLIIDPTLVNNLNSQIFSLSLWIILQNWLKFTQNKLKYNLQISSSFSNNSKTLQNGEFRKIYSIKKGSYPSSSIQNERYQFSSQFKNSKIGSMKDFQIQYKRPLMYNMTLFLLNLDIQTTILKYHPIQNDLIKQMAQCDILPTFLVRNKYLFQSKKNMLVNKNRFMNKSQQNDIKAQLLSKIQQAQTLQDIQGIQIQLKSLQQSSNQNQLKLKDSINKNNQFQNYPLPWMCLIQSKQILLQMISKPFGYSLAAKIIKKHPFTFQKMYQTIIPKLIFTQIQQNYHLYQNNSMYRLQGNRNVKLKKQLVYGNNSIKGSQTLTNSNNKSTTNKQNLNSTEIKLSAMKQILQFYKSNTKEEVIRKLCLKYLHSI